MDNKNEILRSCIDRKKCDGCGECIPVCPVEAIIIKDGKAYVNNTCIACGACASVCPQECIEIKLASAEDDYT